MNIENVCLVCFIYRKGRDYYVIKEGYSISSVSLASVGILAGCGSSEASNAGKYTITSLSVNGTEVNLQDLAKAAGASLDEFYIELKEDGTGSLNAYGEAQNLTWDKKNITKDGEAVPYTVNGNELSIVQEGMTIKAEKK